jgi:hypothetical protein
MLLPWRSRYPARDASFHVDAARRHGVQREELVEIICVAVEMDGRPATVYGIRDHCTGCARRGKPTMIGRPEYGSAQTVRRLISQLHKAYQFQTDVRPFT